MADENERQFTIVEERLVEPDAETWLVTWKSIRDQSQIRRRMSADEYNGSVAGPRDEKPLWSRTQIDPIGEPAAD